LLLEAGHKPAASDCSRFHWLNNVTLGPRCPEAINGCSSTYTYGTSAVVCCGCFAVFAAVFVVLLATNPNRTPHKYYYILPPFLLLGLWLLSYYLILPKLQAEDNNEVRRRELRHRGRVLSVALPQILRNATRSATTDLEDPDEPKQQQESERYICVAYWHSFYRGIFSCILVDSSVRRW